MKVRNVFIIFLVSGFWHGANWTFIVWGALHALYFLPLLLIRKNRTYMDIVAQGKIFPSLGELVSIATTFSLTTFAWIFFRAESVGHALSYVGNMFNGLFNASNLRETFTFITESVGGVRLCLFALFFIVEWFGRENRYAIENLFTSRSRPIRWAFYYSIIIITILYGGIEQEFIYFQF